MNNAGDEVVRLVAGSAPGTLATAALTGSFSQPVAIGTFPGDADRLFVAEQGGKVRLVVNGAVRPTPFLDVAPFGLAGGGERGLLSVVAAPDYASSGKVYVYYTDAGGDIRVDEFTRSRLAPEVADPATRRVVLTIEHSQADEPQRRPAPLRRRRLPLDHHGRRRHPGHPRQRAEPGLPAREAAAAGSPSPGRGRTAVRPLECAAAEC